ncbi:MAG: hypothetical protein P1T08_17620 [Acidimicrobiia bacterium]|nr:hypothetical protein [Acidimicrobiia bacterium]
MGKYDAWRPFFRDLKPGERRVPLEALSDLLEGGLPQAAYEHQAWWSNTGYASAAWAEYDWYAHPKLRDGYVLFNLTPGRRGRSPASSKRSSYSDPRTITPNTPPQTQSKSAAEVILLGCVSEKRDHPAPAKDLYISPLWERRRAYAEASGQPWYILSAEHGLLHPEQVTAPYDVSLKDLSVDQRRAWARRTAPRLLETLVAAEAETVEIHAGTAYTESGLRQALEALGFQVFIPLAHHRIGVQLAWYDNPNHPDITAPRSSPTSKPLQQPAPDHVVRLAADYRSKALGGGWDGLPEVVCVKAMRAAGADDRTIRRWITFAAAMDRARDAVQLWEASVEAYRQAPWIYDPWQVIARPHDDLQAALRQYSVSQRHGPDSDAWQTIAQTLTDTACPGSVIAALNGKPTNASDLLEALQRKGPQGVPRFPLLRGPKIGPLWVRMLACPGGADIRGMEVIPVAVDTHVQRVTEMLGLVSPVELSGRHRRDIQQVWFDAVNQAGMFGAPSPIDGTSAGIDPALWALGREGCSNCERAKIKRPIGSICDLCVLGRVES